MSAGAIQGVLVMIAYWVVESYFLYILPWLREPAYQYTSMHSGFTAIVLGCYIVAGTLGGMIVGAAVKRFSNRPRENMIGLILTLLLSVALSVGLFFRVNPALPSWYLPSIYFPVGFCIAVSLRSKTWSNRLTFLTSPWTAAIFLLAPPFIFDVPDPKPTLFSGTVSLLPYVAGAFLLWFLIPLHRLRMRNVLTLAFVSVLMLVACFLLHESPRRSSSASAATLAANTPNVILITLDTVRADHLSLLGYERDTTPNLKRLAEEATVYTQAIAPGNMTLSSHASMFTSLYPSWHQAHFDKGHDQARPLDAKYPVLAQILADKGFDTVGIVSNYLFLSHGFGLDRGFAYHDSAGPPLMLTKSYVLRNAVRNFLSLFLEPWQYDAIFRRAEEINDAALAVLDKENPGRKFFLFLNYMDAHGPYLPPARFATLYPGRNPRMTARHYGTMERQVLSEKRPLAEGERQHLVSQYDGGIAYMDWCLDQLLDQLKRRGLYDNTLLIITSDHGEAFGERGIMGHGLSVYEDEVRVPLIIKFPNSTTKAVVADSVSLIDLMPTVLDVLGYGIPKGIQGHSLRGRSPHDVVSESFMHPFISTWNPKYLQSEQAIVSGSMKFIESSAGKKELYDLSQDPNELHNLLPAGPAPALETRLTEFMHAAAQGSKFQPPQIGSKTLENLKSLGYLQ